MNKLYSKRAVYLKVFLNLVFVPVGIYLLSLIDFGNFILSFCVPFLVVGCLYTIPFWINVSYMHKYRVENSKQYILKDMLFCFLPACGGAFIYDIVVAKVGGINDLSGIVTIIASILFLIISLIFWVIYLVICKNK